MQNKTRKIYDFNGSLCPTIINFESRINSDSRSSYTNDFETDSNNNDLTVTEKNSNQMETDDDSSTNKSYCICKSTDTDGLMMLVTFRFILDLLI